jgi:hypothetical protein
MEEHEVIDSEITTTRLAPVKNRIRSEHTRLLQRPVDLILVDIIIFHRQEKAKPVGAKSPER